MITLKDEHFEVVAQDINNINSSSDFQSNKSNFMDARFVKYNHEQQRDIVVIGAGVAGLSTALYTALLDPSRHVTVYDSRSNTNENNNNKSATTSNDDNNCNTAAAVASLAAAGMLAPNAERLPSGDLLDLCVRVVHSTAILSNSLKVWLVNSIQHHYYHRRQWILIRTICNNNHGKRDTRARVASWPRHLPVIVSQRGLHRQ